MKKQFIIFLILVSCRAILGQVTKIDTSKGFDYEICVFKKARPGRIIKNKKVGSADTSVAFVKGRVFEKQEPVAFAIVTFTNSSGKVKGTIADGHGYYKIGLNKGEYSVGFSDAGSNNMHIDTLELNAGQIQNIVVELGRNSGFTIYGIKSKKPLTDEQLKARIKELADRND